MAPRKRASKPKASPEKVSEASSSASPAVTPQRQNRAELFSSLNEYTPSFNVVIRLFFMVRALGAITSIISDCDETYNYWEPTHYLQYGSGLQTWEYSPIYAIRSWAYIGIHAIVGKFFELIIAKKKMQIFYFMRMCFALISSYCEASFYRAVVDHVNPRIGRYTLVILLGSAGMYSASVAYLPSTFAMYTTMLAFVYALRSPSSSRTYQAVFWFALGAIMGWPFSGAVGIPFVIEELLVRDSPAVKSHWRKKRIFGLIAASLAGLALLFPTALVDYFYYQKWTFVPFNIITYNVLSGGGKGPNIFGTEPWWFYFVNGILNFNIIFVFALISLPGLLLTYWMDLPKSQPQSAKGIPSPYIKFMTRLAPFYLWLFIFTVQPHKEERFLFVVYPLICLNAAVGLFIVRGWLENLYIKYLAKRVNLDYSFIVTFFIGAVISVFLIISMSRVVGLYTHYQAPLEVYSKFYTDEFLNHTIQVHNGTEVNVCVGKEWYRFPSHYFLPDNFRLKFVRSSFRGLLPKYFYEDPSGKSSRREGTRMIPDHMNDLNHEEMDRYIDIGRCDYLIDVDYPSRPNNAEEPRYVNETEHWSQYFCQPFLDQANSPALTRAFYIPGLDETSNQWGEYCLLERAR
ncbi:mannosyltransferase [Basidiobolus ranarum]|uniref:Mannosyltransferase n=1 Tax=Basidiobolus ranarum TaxID=34480 RepID=A0ABR2W439_9FUNG